MAYLPELLSRILSTNSSEDLCAAGMFVNETAHLINIAVDDDVETLVHSVMLAHVFGGEFFRHCGGDAIQGCAASWPGENEIPMLTLRLTDGTW